MNDNKNVDKTMTDYFDAVKRGTKSFKTLSEAQKQLQEATYIAIDSSLDMAESYGNLKNKADEHSVALGLSTDQMLDTQSEYRKKIEKELDARQKVIDYYSKLPDDLQEQIKGGDKDGDMEDTRNDDEDKNQKDDKEEDKERKGFFKRVRENLEKNAKAGDGFTKTYASRAILSVSGGIKSLFSGLLQQIPMFNEVKAGFSKVKSVASDINQTRMRRKEAKEGKSGMQSKKKESPLTKREKKQEKKDRKKELRNQKKLLKAQSEGNKLLEKINRRMLFQTIFKMFGTLVTGLSSMISSGVSMGMRGLGLVAGLAGLKKILGKTTGVLSSLARTMGIGVKKGTPKTPKPVAVGGSSTDTTKNKPKVKTETAKRADKIKGKTSKIKDVAKKIGKGGAKFARMAGGAAKFAGKMALRAVPGLGWGLLAYDAINFATGGAADEMVGKAVGKAGDAISSAIDSIGGWFSDDDEKDIKPKTEQPQVTTRSDKLEQSRERLEHYTKEYEAAVKRGDTKRASFMKAGMDHNQREVNRLSDRPVNKNALKPDGLSNNGQQMETLQQRIQRAKDEGDQQRVVELQKVASQMKSMNQNITNMTTINNNQNTTQYHNDGNFVSSSRISSVQR